MTTAPPPAHRSAAEQDKLNQALIDLFERHITFNQTLGMQVQLTGRDRPSVRFDMRPALVGHHHYGRLHGGVISAVLDATAGLALMHAIGEKHADEPAAQVMQRFGRMGTIDLRTDFLRQGIGRHFIATADVLRLGGRLGSTTMRLVNDEGMLIATGAASYVLN
ncbi:MAG: thioesterase family protein [Aquabacterium sp.]